MVSDTTTAPRQTHARMDCGPTQLLSGDEAVAWAALDAGIRYASSYPGTPATDVQETVVKFAPPTVKAVWSVNEKVAYESALAAAICGQRALVSMKQMGLNVAADAFMNSCTAGVNGGLVLLVADDPECHSSQHKQDTRHYRALSSTLLLEPCDSQEAYSMTREAFHLSERFRLPVIVRLTVRTAHSYAPVQRQEPENPDAPIFWPKEPGRFFIVPTVSRRLFLRLASLQREFADAIAASSFTHRVSGGDGPAKGLGIICTGVGFMFARDLAPKGAALLKLAGEPFPDTEIAEFVNAHERVIVLEEGDPIIEERVRLLARGTVNVRGRLSGELKPVGELQPEQVKALLTGIPCRTSSRAFADLPLRLPEMCKPCGYHKVFGALRDVRDIATPSDIGCNSLGGLPPYRVMDGLWAMGSSLGVACGLSAMGHERIVAIIGDSTFFHAGIPPLIEAVHEGYSMTVVLLDNGTAAMTGGQNSPHIAAGSHQKRVDLLELIEALGVTRCTVFDPHKLGQDGIRALVERSFDEPGVKVLLYRSQCTLHSPGYGRASAAASSKTTSAAALSAAFPVESDVVDVVTRR